MTHLIALLGGWLAGVQGVVPGNQATPFAAPDEVSASWQAPIPDQGIPVRVWLEEGTDLFHAGTPVRLRFRSEYDAYVAIFHLDPEGRIDLVYPAGGYNAPFIRGGRTHALPARMDAIRLGRAAGIGYFYIVASPYPLDLYGIHRGSGLRGEVWGLGSLVRGDPFWALEQLTRSIVRDYRYGDYGVDFYSYHVGGRHRYPSYACYDRFARDLGGYPYYPSCDRLQRLLVTYPYYYDTRRYRGNRTVYLREIDPRYEMKEPFGRQAPPPVRASDPREPSRPGVRTVGTPSAPAAAPARQDAPRTSEPARARPTLERREAPADGGRPPARAPERGESPPARANPPAREAPQQREAQPPRQSEPARAAPQRREPPRAAPARQEGSARPRARPQPPRNPDTRSDQSSHTAGPTLTFA
jgi:hypothetical protein